MLIILEFNSDIYVLTCKYPKIQAKFTGLMTKNLEIVSFEACNSLNKPNLMPSFT